MQALYERVHGRASITHYTMTENSFNGVVGREGGRDRERERVGGTDRQTEMGEGGGLSLIHI